MLRRRLDVLNGQLRRAGGLSHTWIICRRLCHSLRDAFKMARPWKPSIEEYDKCNRVEM
jgi:hypothetical protein